MLILMLDSLESEEARKAERILEMKLETILRCLVESLYNPCTRRFVLNMLKKLDRKERAEEAAAWLDIIMRSVNE